MFAPHWLALPLAACAFFTAALVPPAAAQERRAASERRAAPEHRAAPARTPASARSIGNGTFIVSEGALTLSDGARLTTPYDITFTGAAFDATAGTLVFIGAAAQTLTAPAALTVTALEVDKSGGAATLGTDVVVTSDLALTNGTLDPGDRKLILPTTVVDGAVTHIATTTHGAGSLSGDFVYRRTFVEGGAGWRMIAFPMAGLSLDALSGYFVGPGGSGPPLVYRHDDTAQAWVQVTDLTATAQTGHGYIVFTEDDPLPLTWDVAGQENAPFTTSLVANETGGSVDPEESYNYVGNPFAGVLDWSAIAPNGGARAGAGLATTHWTWDPSLVLSPYGGSAGFVFYNSSGGTGLAGRYIAPFQGFFVQATATNPSIAFDYTLEANTASPVFVGRHAGERAPQVRFALAGEDLLDPGVYVVFDEAATAGRDPYDVTHLAPLSEDYAILWFAGADGTALAVDGRPMTSGTETFDLEASASQPGTYTLSWPELYQIPEGWSVTLLDRQTGDEVDLRTAESYTFELVGAAARTPASASKGATTAAPRPLPVHRGSGTTRFELRVTDGAATPAEPGPGGDPGLPTAFALESVAPNPFTTRTQVRYTLPAPATVTLAAYDLLGREVARLAEGPKEAGRYSATLDGRGLASGVYLLRFTATSAHGRFAETRRALLVR